MPQNIEIKDFKYEIKILKYKKNKREKKEIGK